MTNAAHEKHKLLARIWPIKGQVEAIEGALPHEPHSYQERLAGFPSLSHVTIEVQPLG
jgi:hypothetical protein